MSFFGNPVYPYLASVFPGEGHWSPEQAQNLDQGLKRGQGSKPWAVISFFWQMFLVPYRFGLTHNSGIMLLLLLPLLFAARRHARFPFLGLGSVLAVFAMLAGARVPRSFLPVFPAVALLLAAGWETVAARLMRWRGVMLGLLLALFLLQFSQGVMLLEKMTLAARFAAGRLTGSIPKDSPYLAIVPYFRAAEFINASLAPKAKIALLGEERTFYIKENVLAASSLDSHPLLLDLAASESLREWRQRMQRRGITHLLFSARGLERFALNSPTYRLRPWEKSKLESFTRELRAVYQDPRYTLYALD
jgi:hypothetical protein